ncbi:MAG: hypothetical protein ABI037_08430, partial [Gemmatimonadales bacterium]
MIRVGRRLVVMLVLGNRRRLDRTGVQPLHRTPADTGGEKQQSERHGSAASEEGGHGTNIEREAA